VEVQRESQVWFTMLDLDRQSAIPVKWKDLKGGAQDEAMVFRPGEGMDGWAPLGQVKQEQKRRSDILDSSAEGASSADAEAAVTVGHGRVRQLTTSNLSMNSTSGPPTNLQRGLSVTADPVTGGLVGLPESWAGLLPQGLSGAPRRAESVPETLRVETVPEEGLKLSDTVIVGRPYNVTRWKPSFGMPLESCELIRINGFDIPRVLEEVASCLRDRGGLREEGIFRIAPMAADCEPVKEALNLQCSRAVCEQVTDLHVLATVIKVWFRMMPVKLLSVVSPAEITSCSTGAQCMQVLQRFPPGHKGVVLWLLDLMADVADQQEHNKMNERAVAIVMAPNLYDAPSSENPLDALMQTQKFTKFLSELLHHYIVVRKRVRSQSLVGPLEHALSDSGGSHVGEGGSEIEADSQVRASGSQHLLASQDVST